MTFLSTVTVHVVNHTYQNMSSLLWFLLTHEKLGNPQHWHRLRRLAGLFPPSTAMFAFVRGGAFSEWLTGSGKPASNKVKSAITSRFSPPRLSHGQQLMPPAKTPRRLFRA
jgi:hypothetical protein